ncbi:hypothetical protein DXN05_16285 [Deminuibacter soli]|uniref:Uncharacterized protein n=2 Tax=Deminuibacter soli TaxID=2291815 RepID=A0A3E1NGF4_9BACT|nr:hypothetical protein DXN05_16285 [Deminuibacter soli]
MGALCWSNSATAQDSLRCGEAILFSRNEEGGYAIGWQYRGSIFSTYDNNHPVSLMIDSVSYAVNYRRLTKQPATWVGEATVETPGGSRFAVKDVYTLAADKAAFVMSREVNVLKAGSDKWFNSFFGVQGNALNDIKDAEVFVPGTWYKDNRYLPQYALAADAASNYFYFREDRLPLPLVMCRNKNNASTVTLMHLSADPQTFFEESGLARITDARMQFGAIGLQQQQNLTALFQFPGCEGDRTYVSRYSFTTGQSIATRGTGNWAMRSHPVQTGIQHRYTLAVRFSHEPDFASALNNAWQYTYQQYHSAVHTENMKAVFNEEARLLNDYWRNIGGAPGWPFSVYLPSGNTRAYDYQMGFIGFQVPNAYYLLRCGLETNNQSMIDKACKVLDFWAAEAATDNGLPKSWAEPYVDKPFGWRKYPQFMRIAGDGMEGALLAWSIMQRHHISKPAWLKLCTGFGDWLVNNQNEDGSYYLNYNWWDNGKPGHNSKYTTTNVIRYLVELYRVTRQQRYLDAAVKAGVFSLNAINNDYLYVGGVIDNPNVKDRESGQQAMYAFMALYDHTKDHQWLDAAVQAARYTETYMYAYHVPMSQGDTLTDFPANKTGTGQTLIATGHSGVDNGLSFSSFQYYRLYLFTGDKHLLQVARMAMYNTLQTMDMDGSMGYRYKALQTEAFSLSGNTRGHSVRQWLAWNTAAVMDPLCRFKDAFNNVDIDAIEKLPLAQRRQLNEQYGKTSGLVEKE